MNSSQTNNTIGIITVATAILGVTISLFGLIGVWMLRESLSTSLLGSLEIAATTLEVTKSGLETANGSLDTIILNISGVQTTILTVGQTINDTVPVVEEFADLFETSFPETIESTQTSLETAQTSAKLMDTVLFAVTNIPFYPGDPYAPEVPLNIALANVVTDLEPLPESLRNVSVDLNANAGNLSALEEGIIDLSITITDINTDLTAAKEVIGEYLVIIDDMNVSIDDARESIPVTLTIASLMFSIFFLWLGLSQIGPFIQGWQIISESAPEEDSTS